MKQEKDVSAVGEQGEGGGMLVWAESCMSHYIQDDHVEEWPSQSRLEEVGVTDKASYILYRDIV